MIRKFNQLTDADKGKWAVRKPNTKHPHEHHTNLVVQIGKVTLDGQRFELAVGEILGYIQADTIAYICDNKHEAVNVAGLLQTHERAKQRALEKMAVHMDYQADIIIESFAVRANTIQAALQEIH